MHYLVSRLTKYGRN